MSSSYTIFPVGNNGTIKSVPSFHGKKGTIESVRKFNLKVVKLYSVFTLIWRYKVSIWSCRNLTRQQLVLIGLAFILI